MKRKSILSCVILIFLGVFTNVSYSTAINDEKEVLLLTAYGGYSIWSNELINIIISEVEAEGAKIQFHIEYMDSSNYQFLSYREEYEEMLSLKYSDIQLDAVMTIGFDAFDFVQQTEIELLQDLPIISGSFDYAYAEGYEIKKAFSGNKTKIDSKEYIDLMLAVQPELEKVYFLRMGQEFCPTGKAIQKEAEKQQLKTEVIPVNDIEPYKNRMEYWEDEETALVISYINSSLIGGPLDGVGVFELIRPYYQGPIYMVDGPQFLQVMHDYKECVGPIGGIVRERDLEGRHLAETLIDSLYRESISNQVHVFEGEKILDYCALNAYGKDHKALKDDATIMNEMTTLWSVSLKWFIIGWLMFMFILSIMVFQLIKVHQKNRILGKAVTTSKERYLHVISSIPTPVILTIEDRISYINDYGILYLDGEKQSDFYGLEILTMFNVTDKRKSVINKVEVTTLQGNRKDVELEYCLYQRERESYIIVLHDISEQKLVEKQKKDNQLKSDFFSNLSHELRTPINIILSTSQLLEKKMDRNCDERWAKYNGILRQNSYQLVRLINNLLDATKIDTGFMAMNARIYNVVELTEYLTLSILPVAESRGIRIVFDTEEEELFARVDQNMFERILLNLLSNGIKYNKENGAIEVVLSQTADWVEIKIKDYGIGIEQERIGCIFDHYEQGNRKTTKDIESSGIGLSVVRALVELHQGTIQVNSQLAHFSEFIISLPRIQIKPGEEYLVSTIEYDVLEVIQVELADVRIQEQGYED